MSSVMQIIERPRQFQGSINSRVTLIRPALMSSLGSWNSPVSPPLAIAYLAAVLRERGIQVDVVDAVGERIDQFIEDGDFYYQGLTIAETVDRIDLRTNLIGISCMFSQDWPWVRRLIAAIRKRLPGVPIVAGGEHVTALAEFSLRDCPELTACVLGEGEETLVDLVAHLDDPNRFENVAGLAYLDGGRFVQTAHRHRIRAVDELPYPAWDLAPIEPFLDYRATHSVFLGRTIAILATRGCPYKCTFCTNPDMYGNLWMPRSPAKVLDEIEYYLKRYAVENVEFFDLTFVTRKSWILEFCRLIEERGLKFTWQLPNGTRSEVIDAEVSAALYRTGCRNLTYAPESGSTETLRIIKKQVDLNKLQKSAAAALAAGLSIKMNVILGFPHETRRHLLQTLWFCWRMAFLGVYDMAVFVFSPYPGSELFEQLLADGTIKQLDDNYLRSLAAFMDPFPKSNYCRHISARELSWWVLLVQGTFYGLSFAFRPWRFFCFARNLLTGHYRTVLEQRVGSRLRRPKTVKSTAYSTS